MPGRFVLFLAIVLASLGLVGCRIEISTTRASAAPGPPPSATAVTPPRAVTPTPGLAAAATPSPTPPATEPATIPAKSPPERIVAPAIGLDAAVIPMGWKVVERDGLPTPVWEVPTDAAGWHQNSSLPGHGGNIVLSGHHNIGSEVFRDVVNLRPGDKIVLTAGGREYRYVVTDRFILPERGASEEQRRQNAQWIMPAVAERLTLVTCWPYTDNSHRVIVLAVPDWS